MFQDTGENYFEEFCTYTFNKSIFFKTYYFWDEFCIYGLASFYIT